jgi:dihydrofolate reductase
MRKLVSYLFISLDGVVEAPDRFVRDDLYPDLDPLIGEAIAEQDAVLLGRRTYDDWAAFWPRSDIQPFSRFINRVPKHVASRSLQTLAWKGSTQLPGDLLDGVMALKRQAGGAIGVHGSISLVQSLMVAGLLDELRLVLCPVVVGQGRRLLSHEGEPLRFALHAHRTTPSGLQDMVFRPRAG